MKEKYSIYWNGTRYFEEGKCPACSSEFDNGGRLQLQKRKRRFLKCDRCKYTILSVHTRSSQERNEEYRRDSAVGL